MSKLSQALKSRTVWSILLGYVVLAEPILPPAWKAFVDAVIGLLSIYFHLNPSQSYQPGTQAPEAPAQ